MLVSTFTLHRCLLLALLFTGGLGGQTRTLRYAKTSTRPAVGSSDDTVVYRAVDVLQPTTNSSVFHLRQLSRGEELLRMLYAADGMLADCVWSREADDVAEFTGRFDATHADNANAATVAADDDDATPNVDFDSAKKECLSLHKMDGVAADAATRMRSNHVRRRRAVLYPGTNWCGRGNQARNFNDLGREEHADRCCRQHDHCPTTIRSLSSRYNYFNYRLHTISHCECDNTLRNCLRAAGSSAANVVGSLYFNYLKSTCFVIMPTEVCAERSWWGTCARYDATYTAVVRQSLSYGA